MFIKLLIYHILCINLDTSLKLLVAPVPVELIRPTKAPFAWRACCLRNCFGEMIRPTYSTSVVV